MIRLIIAFFGLVLIWLLWRKDLNKQQKIAAILALLAMFIAGTWWEIGRDKPSDKLVELTSVTVCDVKVTPSYRTNYQVDLCVQNSSDRPLVRIGYTLMAQLCAANDCQQIEQISREIPVSVGANSRNTIRENVRFEELAQTDQSSPDRELVFKASIDSLLAK